MNEPEIKFQVRTVLRLLVFLLGLVVLLLVDLLVYLIFHEGGSSWVWGILIVVSLDIPLVVCISYILDH